MSNFNILFLESSHENTQKLFDVFEKKTNSVCFISKFKIINKDITNQFMYRDIDKAITKNFKYIIFDEDLFKMEVYIVSKIKKMYEEHYNKSYNVIIPFIYNKTVNYQTLLNKNMKFFMYKSGYTHSLNKYRTINTISEDTINGDLIMNDDKQSLDQFIDNIVRLDNINEILN